jgi:hypothetical protein
LTEVINEELRRFGRPWRVSTHDSPRASSARAVCAPMKPSPPVIRIIRLAEAERAGIFGFNQVHDPVGAQRIRAAKILPREPVDDRPRLTDLHPDLELAEHAIAVQSSAATTEHELRGAGLLLVPCVFAWPHVMIDIDAGNPPSITYAPAASANCGQKPPTRPQP